MSEKHKNVRIIKISKESVFEITYETFLDKIKEYFDIKKPEEFMTHYCMNYKTGEFIMIAAKDDSDKSLEIDATKLIDKFNTTTNSMYNSTKKYIELDIDEILNMQKNET